jgi:cytochrome P450
MSDASAGPRCPVAHDARMIESASRGRTGTQFMARLHEARVYASSQPVLWMLATLTRRLGRVARIPGVGVVVNDAEVARAILQRDEDFPKCGRGGFAEQITRVLGPSALGNMDGAAHRAVRARLATVFTPAHAAALTSAVCAAPIAELRAELAAGRSVDLVPFARRLTGRTMCRIVGLTPPPGKEDRTHDELAMLAQQLSTIIHWRPASERQLRSIEAARQRLFDHLRECYDDRDASARSDSVMGRLRAQGLTLDEARGALIMLLVAGTVSLTAALPRIVAVLIDTGQLAVVQRHPESVARAVAEGLRFVAPVPATTRIAARNTSVGGVQVNAGTRMLILTMNVARDPRHFPRPDRFDVDRVHDPAARQPWYGAGPHFCLGVAIAQCQLTAALTVLAETHGTVEIVRRRPARHVLLPGYAMLAVRVHPRVS